MPPIKDQAPRADSSAPKAKPRLDAATDPLEKLADHFKTDLSSGLSPKTAEERLNRRTDESIFEAPFPGPWTCIKPVLSEPVMWLLLAVCLVALFFNRTAIGLFCALLLAAHGCVCVYLNYQALRHEGNMQAYDIPLTRVLRNRRLLRVRGDHLVPGDVILLRRGDVIPCDVRLISSRNLTVAEETLRGSADERETVILDKDSSVIPDVIPHHHSPENMVYAGAVVKKGQGRALVVAVASRTHMGALVGRVKPSHPHELPPYVARLKKTLSVMNLVLSVAVIPVTALGILTLRGRYEFLDVFMSALALSVLTLTEHTLSLLLSLYTESGKAATEDKDTDNSADIRSPVISESLGRMDHLILMGSAALHDGISHPVQICTSGEMYRVGEAVADMSVKLFAEKLHLFAMGQADRTRSGVPSAIPHLEDVSNQICDWAEPDTEAILLRLERMEAKGNGVTLEIKGQPKTTLYLSDDPDVMADCHVCRFDGGVAPMDRDNLNGWQTAVGICEQNGYRMAYLLSETRGELCLEGFIAMTVEFCRKTKGCIRSLESEGICVTAFLRGNTPEDELTLADAGLLDAAPALNPDFEKGGINFEEALSAGTRAFVNCRTDDVLTYIQSIRRKGGCVGVVSAERIDLPLLDAADIAITCAPAEWRAILLDGQPAVGGAAGTRPDGEPDGVAASDLCRQRADIVIRRCGAHGGGVCGIRRAFLAAGQMSRGVTMSLRFLLISQVLRILMLVLPLLTGAACLSAPTLLVSGFVMDLLAVICYMRCDFKDDPARKDAPMPSPSFKGLWNYFKAELILGAATCAVPVILTPVTRILQGSAFGDLAFYLALSLTATQIALFATGHRPRCRRRGFFVLVLMACVYVGLLSVALASGLHVLYCLVLPLVQPLIWLVGYAIIKAAKGLRYQPF